MDESKPSFNRTSMESKHGERESFQNEVTTFNRTSMESKRCLMVMPERLTFLLIEPVWNRNVFMCCKFLTESLLLIEPVWNRNVGS